MSDLSTLFTPQLITNSLHSLSSQTTPQPATSKSITRPMSLTRGQIWSLNEVQISLRKGMKKQVSMKSLKDELQSFAQKVKEQYIVKGIALVIIVILFHCIFSDYRISFHLALFLVLKTLPCIPFLITQDQLIKKGVKSITNLGYAALFYYILKWTSGENMSEFNLTLTLASIIFVCISLLLDYYEPIFKLTSQDSLFQQIHKKGILNKIPTFLDFAFQRIKYFQFMASTIIALGFTVFALEMGALIFLERYNLSEESFKLKLWINSILVFSILQFVIFVLKALEEFFFVEIKVVRNKTPIFLSLLRLQGNSSYRYAVHKKCLTNMVVRMQEVKCFMSTQTCKSLMYNSYMDIFTQFATIELGRTIAALTQSLGSMRENEIIYNSKKTWQQDLFISCRKLRACLGQTQSAIRLMQSLSQNMLLIRTITLADQQAFLQKENIRIPPRNIELIQIIVQKLQIASEYQSLSSKFRAEILMSKHKLSAWVFSMRKGWV